MAVNSLSRSDGGIGRPPYEDASLPKESSSLFDFLEKIDLDSEEIVDFCRSDEFSPKQLNNTNQNQESPVVIACKKQDDKVAELFILNREPYSPEDVQAKLDRWKPKFRAEQEGADKPFLIFLSRLTWSNLSDLLVRRNMQKYFCHLHHFSGALFDTRTMKKKELETLGKEKPQKFIASLSEEEFKDYKVTSWKVERFLPLRIRSYVIIYYKTFGNSFHFSSPTIRIEEFRKKIIEQITIDLETIKCKKTFDAIKSIEALEARDRLLTCYEQSLWSALKKSEVVLSKRFQSHTIYIRFALEDDRLLVTIQNVGSLAELHQTFKGRSRFPMRFPYVFTLPATFDQFSEYLRKTVEASIKLAKEAKDLFYPDGDSVIRLSLEELIQRKYPTHDPQTTGNCTLVSHNVGVNLVFRSQVMYQELLMLERSIAGQGIGAGGSSSVGLLSPDERSERACDSYDKGLLYEINESPNWDAAFACYAEAVKGNHMGAHARLGCFLFYGMGTVANVEKAIEHLSIAEKEKEPFAQFLLAMALSEGIGLLPDKERALSLLEAASSAGDGYAKYELGKKYLEGVEVKANKDKGNKLLQEARRLLEQQAEKGDVMAAYYLSLLLKENGAVWLQRSVKGHFPPAEVSVADQFLEEKTSGLRNCNTDIAISHCKALLNYADNGYYLAQYSVARHNMRSSDIYKLGGPPIGSQIEWYYTAFKYYRMSAKQGYAKSWTELGICYMENIGHNKRGQWRSIDDPSQEEQLTVEQRQRKAVECFIEAEKRADPIGTYRLGFCYLNQFPGLEDYNRGFQFLRRAVELGSLEARSYLARVYATGTSCVADQRQALKYALTAKDRHHESALLSVKLLLNKQYFEEAYKILSDMAEPGFQDCHAVAYTLAALMWNGLGTEKNRDRALAVLEESAENGNIPSIDVLLDHYAYTYSSDRSIFEKYERLFERKRRILATTFNEFPSFYQTYPLPPLREPHMEYQDEHGQINCKLPEGREHLISKFTAVINEQGKIQDLLMKIQLFDSDTPSFAPGGFAEFAQQVMGHYLY